MTGADTLVGVGGDDELYGGPPDTPDTPGAGDEADGGEGIDTCLADVTTNCEG